jgi:hypothetical protein
MSKVSQRKGRRLGGRKKSRDSQVRVTSALKVIKSLYNGDSEDGKQVIKRELTSSDYEELLVRIARDRALQGYFNNKGR